MHIIVFRVNIFDRSAGHADSTSISVSSSVVASVAVWWLTSSSTVVRGTSQACSITILIVEVVESIVRIGAIVQTAIIIDTGNLITVHKIERE